jgi:hypothetical protein
LAAARRAYAGVTAAINAPAVAQPAPVQDDAAKAGITQEINSTSPGAGKEVKMDMLKGQEVSYACKPMAV